jgi:flagellar protein FlaJ
MNSTTSSPKQIEKVSSDNVVIGFDLLSNLTYMLVLSIGGLQRDRVLESCGELKLRTAVFFEFIYVLANRVGLEYSEAFRLVAGRAGASRVKSLLLRFAAALGSGESEQEFILEETRLEGDRYGNEYERSVENLRKWSDAYSAILVSVSLIMVVSLVSSLLGSLDVNFVILMAFTLFCVTSIGVFLIYKVAPFEDFTYDSLDGSPSERKRSRKCLYIGIPIGIILAIILGSQFDVITGSAVAFLVFGIAIFPAGYYAWKDDANVANIDSEIHVFIRSVGSIAGATGSTLTESIRRFDARSLRFLEPYINRLHTRLAASIPTRSCWERFRAETGSELVNRSTVMLVDGAERGGRADRVGEIAGDFAGQISQLRATRALAASTFSYLSFPMHATVVFILVFVFQIVAVFSNKLEQVQTEALDGAVGNAVVKISNIDAPPGISLPSGGEGLTNPLGSMFGANDLGTMSVVIVFCIVILTVSNSLAPKFASGGSNLKIASYLSVMCILTGGLMSVIPMITKVLFTI